MRIACVIDYFQPQIGYQETYLAKIHQRMGHQVSVITSDRYIPFANYSQTIGRVLGNRMVGSGTFQEEGLSVYRLPCILEHGSTVLLRGLRQTLRALRPDVVSVDGVFTLTAFAIAYHNGALGYPLVYDTHTSTFNTQLTGTLLKELKHRFEDALSAARSGLEEGIVPGGGVTLLRAAMILDDLEAEGDVAAGVRIIKQALHAPTRQIAMNAGYEGGVVAEKILGYKSHKYGFNAATEQFEDLVAAGVTDPAKVVRAALENAASIGALVLTTEALVAEIPQDAPAMPPGGDMGGGMY